MEVETCAYLLSHIYILVVWWFLERFRFCGKTLENPYPKNMVETSKRVATTHLDLFKCKNHLQGALWEWSFTLVPQHCKDDATRSWPRWSSIHICWYLGVSINWDPPIAGWFISWKIQKWMIWGYPYDLWNPHLSLSLDLEAYVACFVSIFLWNLLLLWSLCP